MKYINRIKCVIHFFIRIIWIIRFICQVVSEIPVIFYTNCGFLWTRMRFFDIYVIWLLIYLLIINISYIYSFAHNKCSERRTK